jgi:hypothetical protein
MFDIGFMRDCVTIAQSIAPFETGNLRFNAIRLIIQPFGFSIEYLLNVAPYILFLQRGTKFSDTHKGFIDDTVNAIALYMRNKVQGIQNNLNATRNRVAQTAINNPARNQRFLQGLAYKPKRSYKRALRTTKTRFII